MLKYDNNDPNYNNNIKKKITVTVVWFAISLLIILVIINIDPISTFVSGIMKVISPVVIGGAIAYLLNPILKFFEFVVFKKLKNKGLIRSLSLIFTYLLAIAFITLIIAVIAPQLVESLLDIVKNYNTYLNSALNVVNGFISGISSNFESFDSTTIKNYINEFFVESENVFKTIAAYAVEYGTKIITVVKNIIIGLFISIYILISKERLYAQATKGARAYMSNKMYNNCLRYLRITNATFGRFFIGKFFDATIVFGLTWIVLSILKIKYPLLIAMIVGVLTIIPFFGIIIGTVISSLIVIFVASDKVVLFVIIMLIVQFIDTNVIAPKILGNSAGISSLGVVIAVTVMGSYFGVIGMILGVPFFAILISIVKKWLEKRLSSRQLPINTKEYYSDVSYSAENEEHRSLIRIIIDPVLKLISKHVYATVHNDSDTEEAESDTTESQADVNNASNEHNSDRE